MYHLGVLTSPPCRVSRCCRLLTAARLSIAMAELIKTPRVSLAPRPCHWPISSARQSAKERIIPTNTPTSAPPNGRLPGFPAPGDDFPASHRKLPVRILREFHRKSNPLFRNGDRAQPDVRAFQAVTASVTSRPRAWVRSRDLYGDRLACRIGALSLISWLSRWR